MKDIRAKKNLGQHFLTDKDIAGQIAGTLTGVGYSTVLEVGPGTGMLTGFLEKRGFGELVLIEIDNESYYYLKDRFPGIKNIIRGDFLSYDLSSICDGPMAVIGNFPYNISTQILFRILDNRDKVIEVCGMLQKEVSERICSGPGKKSYGILSVLIQAFYSAEYLFTVHENVFSPPPKVKSGVIRLIRNDTDKLNCDEKLFKRVVKAGFSQRRKTLRNSIRSSFTLSNEDCSFFGNRPEELSVQDFVDLTNWVSENALLTE